MEDTLPDDAWKDSFDKLLDPRPQLRELNIIKKNVRASFNIDSSVENSNPDILIVNECSLPNPNFLNVGDPFNIKRKSSSSISTPCQKRLSSNLFYCALSPITSMKLDGLQTNFDHKVSEIGKEQPRAIKHVCFEINASEHCEKSDDSKDKSRNSKQIPEDARKRSRSSLVLQPGKWRKSLHTWKRTFQTDAESALIPKVSSPRKRTTTENLASARISGRKSTYLNDSSESNIQISYEKEVLRYCAQRRPLRFDSAYAAAKMMSTCKIGEGVYGEVFKYIPKKSSETTVVLKIIPIEGSELVNGEVQKTFEQILPEIIISQEMSNLRVNPTNSTIGFVNIYNVALVKGKYPLHLLKLWEEYDEKKESENDHPEMFTDRQLYIVLELNFAGNDMSTFTFLNAEQSYHALQQVILTLAVGEEAFQFEHRDLHWGNILVEETELKHIDYKLNGKDMPVATKGVRVTIIDYTLSRVTVGECCHYNDLSTDEELFAALGDYQYDIYRMMRDELKNNWSAYAPKTNVMWLSYVVSKLIDGVIYKNTTNRTHKTYLAKLKAFNKIVLTFKSAVECANHIYSLN
ncbi:putative serine/threonine-protein kinase haspin homolog [Drosophila innubila]|uniref:putative serine/threonine-protein kinase haspin homolog n=1 Tax=Drosophila innubila TaxID=198719 RepID=UPI00148D0E7A|nr:putative serine/threonine-protein kinase haspin homolog [Drosophila innubila]